MLFFLNTFSQFSEFTPVHALLCAILYRLWLAEFYCLIVMCLLCLLIIENRPFLLPGRYFCYAMHVWGKFKSTKWNVFMAFKTFLCFQLISGLDSLAFEYVRQLINLYNKIETINLLVFFIFSYAELLLIDTNMLNNFIFLSVFINRKISRKNSLSHLFSFHSKFLILCSSNRYHQLFIFSNYKASPSDFLNICFMLQF